MTIPILQGQKTTQLAPLSELNGTETMYLVDNTGLSRKASTSLIVQLLSAGGIAALLASNNLSDVPNKAQARFNLGLGNMSLQNPNSVAIAGGAINNTPIGASAPSTGRFTDLIVTGSFLVPPGSINLSSIGGQIPNSKLEHSSVNVSYQNGLGGSSNVSLGGTLNLTINFVDGGDF